MTSISDKQLLTTSSVLLYVILVLFCSFVLVHLGSRISSLESDIVETKNIIKEYHGDYGIYREIMEDKLDAHGDISHDNGTIISGEFMSTEYYNMIDNKIAFAELLIFSNIE